MSAPISIRLSQINTASDTLGRVNLEDVEPGQTAKIKAGTSNLAAEQILIFDADGDPAQIPAHENDRTDNVGWDIRFIGNGVNAKERICSFIIGKVGDDKIETNGSSVPFEGIREARDAKTHYNKAHFRVLDGHHGQAFFRQWREVNKVRLFSDWFGAEDGNGLRVGRQ